MIKAQDLDQYLTAFNKNLCLIFGNDLYLSSDALNKIKQTFCAKAETEIHILHINHDLSWDDVFNYANNYALLSAQTLIDVRCSAKHLDANFKNLVNKNLINPNLKNLIIITALDANSKNLNWLTHKNALLIQASPLTPKLLQNWLIRQFKTLELIIKHESLQLIQEYTQNNMYKAHQLLEKLSLNYEAGTQISTEMILQHLNDDSIHPLYAITDACLNNDFNTALCRLRQARQQHLEPILILWSLTQEIRLLVNIQHQLQQNKTLSQITQTLKIWPSKINLYAACVKRLSYNKLLKLLQIAQSIDHDFKSYQMQSMWDRLEQLAVYLIKSQLILMDIL